MEFFTLENKNGLRLKLTNYGGIVSELLVPDMNGKLSDITLGFERIEDYQANNPAYFGAIIGRFGNRIGQSRFYLEGINHDGLAANDGANHLHGGVKGFDKVEWEAESLFGPGFVGIQLRYRSADGEEGYPGNLDASVTYKLTDENRWEIEYEATTDRTTVFNPTQHAYFNLAGHDGPSPLDQELMINASYFTPGDAGGIPTGEIRPVAGSGLDFRESKEIGKDIDSDEEEIRSRGGFDHNFVLDKRPEELALAAVAWHRQSGRQMKVFTTEPGLQFYSGNFLDGSLQGKGGARYEKRSGFCLEAQHFPDAPNKGHFPLTTLRPGATFRSKTVYEFGLR